MTLKELMDHVLSTFPDAMFDECETGEVVVYLGVAADPDDDWQHGTLPVRPID